MHPYIEKYLLETTNIYTISENILFVNLKNIWNLIFGDFLKISHFLDGFQNYHY